jgi:hypothetical protein
LNISLPVGNAGWPSKKENGNQGLENGRRIIKKELLSSKQMPDEIKS